MLLRYVGTDPATDWIAGWPASDHDEPDAEVAKEKRASRLYEEVTSKRAPVEPVAQAEE